MAISFDVSTVESWIAVVSSALALIGVIFGATVRKHILEAIKWPFAAIFNNFGNKDIDTKLEAIMAELRPNSGSTLRDAIEDLRAKTSDLYAGQGMLTSKFIAILDQPSNPPIFETDSIGRCTWASASYLTMTGRPFDEIKGYGWTNAIHPDDLHHVRLEWDLAVSQQRVFEHTYRFMHIGGKITKVHAKAVPTIVNGTVSGWMGFLEILSPKSIKVTTKIGNTSI